MVCVCLRGVWGAVFTVSRHDEIFVFFFLCPVMVEIFWDRVELVSLFLLSFLPSFFVSFFHLFARLHQHDSTAVGLRATHVRLASYLFRDFVAPSTIQH